MTPSPVEIIRSLAAQRLTNFPGESFSLLADDVVFLSWEGHVFVGHEGMVLWFEDALRKWENIGFRVQSSVEVKPGWVLTSGDILFTDREGKQRVQPGWWLARVREGTIRCVLYFRTQEEARNALPRDEGGGD